MRLYDWLAVGLATGIALAYYLLLHKVGAFSDEGSCCTIAQGILQGHQPYQDYFNEKPPLQYYWTALVFAFLGDTMDSARMGVALLLAVALALSLAPLARHAQGWRILFWALALAVAGLTMRAYNNLAESALALLGVVSLRAALGNRPDNALRSGFAAGMSQGLSCGFRLTACFNTLVLAFAPWQGKGRAAYFFGVGLALAAWAGLLAVEGLLPAFFDATLWFHWNNPAGLAYLRGLQEIDQPGFLIWLGVMLAAAFAAFRHRQPWVVPVLLGAALSFLGRMDAFRLWPSTMMGFAYLFTCAGPAPRARLVWITGSIALLVVATQVKPEQGFRREQAIADTVTRLSQPDDRIWVAPFLPNVYCLAGRRPASRYYFILPWTLRPDVRRRLLDELRMHPPRVLVDASNAQFALDRMLPEIRPLLEAEYVLVERQRGVAIYLRTAPARE